jgi:LPS-assembly protein
LMKFFKIYLVLLLGLLPLDAFGKEMAYASSLTTPVDIYADTLEQNRSDKTYIARGHVVVREGTRVLNADYVLYSDETKDLLAEGHVVFKEEDDTVECDRLSLNLVTKMGTIEKGSIFLKKGNFHLAGDRIDKVGEDLYNIKRGTMTTCDDTPPSWRFTASDVEVTVDGYAKTKSARFQVKDHTLLYMPYGMFPVKTDRQSGLLLPELHTSTRNGMVLRTSYFWAMSKDKDMTFGLDYIENRGLMPSAEFRYALRDDLKGKWNYSILSDKSTDSTRWQLLGQHEQVLARDLTLKANINLVSDMDYLKDLAWTVYERAESQLKSTVFVEKQFSKSLLTAEMAYFRNLLVKDNDPTYKYLPFISYYTEYIPILKDKFYTDLSSSFTNFYREKGETVSRLTFEPSIRFPYSIKGINFLGNATWIETAYLVNRSDTEDSGLKRRETFKLEGDVNTQFVRNYRTDTFGLGQLQSLIKPQVQYTFIPSTSFNEIPSVDPYDRIYKTNTMTYSLNHYLNSITPERVREVSLLEIRQTYGLSGNLGPSDIYTGSGSRFSDIDAKLTLYPTQHLQFTHQSAVSTSGGGISLVRNGITHMIPKVYYGTLTHTYTRDLNNEAILDIGGRYKVLDAKYQIRYSFTDAEWIDTLYQLSYRPQCWAVTLRLIQSTRPRDTRLTLSFDLLGISGASQSPYMVPTMTSWMTSSTSPDTK